MENVYISYNPNGDTRTVDPNNLPNLKEFHAANSSHRADVKQVMTNLSNDLFDMGVRHDCTKTYGDSESIFYKNFVESVTNGEDFTKSEWYQYHIRKERHHPTSYCHDDINLLDLIEMIADVVCAAKSRSGTREYIPEISDEILRKAYENTLELVWNSVRCFDFPKEKRKEGDEK